MDVKRTRPKRSPKATGSYLTRDEGLAVRAPHRPVSTPFISNPHSKFARLPAWERIPHPFIRNSSYDLPSRKKHLPIINRSTPQHLCSSPEPIARPALLVFPRRMLLLYNPTSITPDKSYNHAGCSIILA